MCDRYCFFVQGKMIELGEKLPGKDKLKTLDVITSMPLVGVNHRQPILHMYKRMVHCYSTDQTIHQL